MVVSGIYERPDHGERGVPTGAVLEPLPGVVVPQEVGAAHVEERAESVLRPQWRAAVTAATPLNDQLGWRSHPRSKSGGQLNAVSHSFFKTRLHGAKKSGSLLGTLQKKS